MSMEIEYLIENKTAKQLVEVIENDDFTDIIAMDLFELDGEEASHLNELTLEEIVHEALSILLKGRELTVQFIKDCCEDYKTTVERLLDDGTILEFEGKMYECDGD